MLERHSTASPALAIARTVLSGPSETNTGALNEVSAILISIGKCAVGQALQQRRRHEACDETMKKPLMKMFPSLSRMIALGQTSVLCPVHSISALPGSGHPIVALGYVPRPYSDWHSATNLGPLGRGRFMRVPLGDGC